MKKTRTTSALGFLLGTLLLATGGCDILSPENRWDRLEDELRESQRRWERKEPSAYSFLEFQTCECIANFEGAVRVWVEAGVVTRVEKAWTGEAVPEDLWGHWDTPEMLFDLIAEAIEDNVAVLEVDYDGERGFPMRLELDRNATYVDDELVVELSDFRVEEG